MREQERECLYVRKRKSERGGGGGGGAVSAKG